MKKKILFLLASLIMILSLVGCASSRKYRPGVYQASAKGYYYEGKEIVLTVTINEEGQISDVKILDHGETPETGGKALEELVKDVIDSNSKDVDMVSKATVTSKGFLEALDLALEKAKK